jgi:hypothetical protein
MHLSPCRGAGLASTKPVSRRLKLDAPAGLARLGPLMTASQRMRLWSRWCVAGLIAAFYVCLSPSLQAAVVVVETFTDYATFLKMLGPDAQVITFDDVPTLPFPGEDPSGGYRFGNFLSDRYASQGILFQSLSAQPSYGQSVWSGPTFGAVSLPNVYSAVLSAGPAFPGAFREESNLFFTHDGGTALTSAFGTFFIGNQPIDGGNFSGMSAYGADGSILYTGVPGLTGLDGSTFLGFATVDSATEDLVPAISKITVTAGLHDLIDVYLDNFTFATPVSPVPEANVWVLLAATMLAAVGRARLRAAAP